MGAVDAESRIAQLEERLAVLEDRVGVLDDTEAIRRLQYVYGYYLDKTFYHEVVDLFAEDSEVRFLHGIFKGKEGVRRLYAGRFLQKFAEGRNGPAYGRLLDHPQMQGVITVAPDRRTARARFRAIMQAGTHQSIEARQRWEGVIYENEYVKEGGRWLFKLLNLRQIWHCTYEHGWAYVGLDYPDYITETYPDDPNGPDEIDDSWHMYPDLRLFDYHYPHPITGQWVTSDLGGPPDG